LGKVEGAREAMPGILSDVSQLLLTMAVAIQNSLQTAMKYEIRSIPMQLFFKDGELVDSVLGAVSGAQIRTKGSQIKFIPGNPKRAEKISK